MHYPQLQQLQCIPRDVHKFVARTLRDEDCCMCTMRIGTVMLHAQSGGYTWLDDLHQPFWNAATELLPRWLAPNLITLTGLACLFAAYLLTIVYLPDFQGVAPAFWHMHDSLAC